MNRSAPSGATDAEVLIFELSNERYCVGIDYVAEIVDVGSLTALPNAPPSVMGVMDLRGRTTTIVDPRSLYGLDRQADPSRVVVFDPDRTADDRAVGWAVDEVDQVVRVSPDEVDRVAAASDETVRGVVRRDDGDGFLVWVVPGRIESREVPAATANSPASGPLSHPTDRD